MTKSTYKTFSFKIFTIDTNAACGDFSTVMNAQLPEWSAHDDATALAIYHLLLLKSWRATSVAITTSNVAVNTQFSGTATLQQATSVATTWRNGGSERITRQKSWQRSLALVWRLQLPCSGCRLVLSSFARRKNRESKMQAFSSRK